VKKWNWKSFITGILISVIIISGVTAFSDGVKKKIDVWFGQVNLVVNGVPAKNETILYDGRTYVQLHETAEILGIELTWDGDTDTAYIDKPGTNRTIETEKTPETNATPMPTAVPTPKLFTPAPKQPPAPTPESTPTPKTTPVSTPEQIIDPEPTPTMQAEIYYAENNIIPDFGAIYGKNVLYKSTDSINYTISYYYTFDTFGTDYLQMYNDLLISEGFVYSEKIVPINNPFGGPSPGDKIFSEYTKDDYNVEIDKKSAILICIKFNYQ